MGKIKLFPTTEYSSKQPSDPVVPLVPCTGIFLKPSKSGKTVALISLILEQYRGVFERIYVFSPSVNIDDGWIPVKKYIEGDLGVNTEREQTYWDEWDEAALRKITASEMTRLLELFCGTKSVGRAFEAAGCEVVSLDIVSKFEPTILCDIRSWDYTTFAGDQENSHVHRTRLFSYGEKKGAELRNEACTQAGRSDQRQGGKVHVHRGLPSGRAGAQGGRGGAVGARQLPGRRGQDRLPKAFPGAARTELESQL